MGKLQGEVEKSIPEWEILTYFVQKQNKETKENQ